MDQDTYEALVALDPEAVIEQFLAATVRTDSSRRSYRYDLDTYLEWAVSVSLHPIAAAYSDINRYVRFLEKQDLAPRTRNRKMSTLRSFFGFVSERWRVQSPVTHPDAISLPKDYPSSEDPALVLDIGDFERIMETAFAALPPSHALAVGLIGVNGLKSSEVIRANVEDVVPSGEGLELRLPIRGDGASTPLVGVVLELARAATDDRSSGPLMLNNNGVRMTPFNLRGALRKIGRDLGVEPVNPQRLRSTAGVVAALDGATSRGIREMLGVKYRRAEGYLVHASALPEEHAAFRVWRRLSTST